MQLFVHMLCVLPRHLMAYFYVLLSVWRGCRIINFLSIIIHCKILQLYGPLFQQHVCVCTWMTHSCLPRHHIICCSVEAVERMCVCVCRCVCMCRCVSVGSCPIVGWAKRVCRSRGGRMEGWMDGCVAVVVRDGPQFYQEMQRFCWKVCEGLSRGYIASMLLRRTKALLLSPSFMCYFSWTIWDAAPSHNLIIFCHYAVGCAYFVCTHALLALPLPRYLSSSLRNRSSECATPPASLWYFFICVCVCVCIFNELHLFGRRAPFPGHCRQQHAAAQQQQS